MPIDSSISAHIPDFTTDHTIISPDSLETSPSKSHAAMSHSGPRRLRSEYLKNGCKECKRRKIKCDEFRSPPREAVRVINAQGRELCWQCTRLKKECEYPMKGEKVARVLLKVLMEKEREENAAKLGRARELSIHNGAANGPGAQPLLPSAVSAANVAPLAAPVGPSIPDIARPAILVSSPNPVAPGFLRYPGAGASGPDNVHLPALPYSVAGGVESFVPAHPIAAHLYGPGYVSPMPAAHTSRSFPVMFPVTGPPAAVPHPAGPGIQSAPFNLMDIGTDASQYYDHSDLTLLATDLNNLVSDMMYEANPDAKSLLDLDLNPTPPTPTSDETSSVEHGKLHIGLHDWIPRNVSLNYVDVRRPEERLFLQEFYLEFSHVILPFNAYDRSLQGYYNPVRDILLKCASKEPFLLAAILAQGARSSFYKSGVVEDEEAYCHYLLRCLKLLGPALGHASTKNGLALTSNIEAVLLTVLLLTSSNAANAKQNWRPHLKGAKDLLLKHTTNRPHVRNSKVLIFCKYWFMSFEILAGLGLKLGGTIHLEEELDLLLNLLDPYELLVLTELGLVLPNGFNLIGGYHNEFIYPWRDLIKLLNKIRRNKDYVPNETLEYIRLLSEFHRQLNIPFVNRKSVFELEAFPAKMVPNGLLLEPISEENKSLVISWMDLSQQLYALAGTITILTEFLKLSEDSPQVQEVTLRFTSLLEHLTKTEDQQAIKYAPMMIQWPVLVAGLNSVKESDRQSVTRFFSAAAKLGAGSAGHSMRRLRRVWRKHDNGGVDDSGDELPVDVVTY